MQVSVASNRNESISVMGPVAREMVHCVKGNIQDGALWNEVASDGHFMLCIARCPGARYRPHSHCFLHNHEALLM
jgi:hypothetical protein